jgi:dethiobiotin synthetase
VVALVVGTGTEVGKTWLTARVIEQWRAQGGSAAARKPAQSFDPGDDAAGRTDAQVLADAAGDDPRRVCPAHRWYPVAMAPPIAASVLGRAAFTVADLAAELSWPPDVDLGFVETAGGVRSPQADDGDVITLLDTIRPDMELLLADAGLGTINAVALTLEALATATHRATATVFLNRYDGADELHRRNEAWLRERRGLQVVTAVPDVVEGIRAAMRSRSG